MGERVPGTHLVPRDTPLPMTELVVETPEGLALRFDVAGAGSRSAAGIVDTLLWALLLLLALTLAQLFGGMGSVWIGAGATLSLIGYHALFGVFGAGRTPGKRLMGLEVYDEHGFVPTPAQHLLRSVFWPLEAFLMVPVPIGIVVMAATPRHQRLGDMVAGTVVLRRPVHDRVAEPLRGQSWSHLPARRLGLVPAHGARFDGRDLALLAELLGRLRLDPEARRRLNRGAGRGFAERLGMDPEPFLASREDTRAFLVELYLFLREGGRAA